MAQEIIVTQLDEIAAMRLAVGLPPDAAPSLSQSDPKPGSSPIQE
jgi:hypothetical protein